MGDRVRVQFPVREYVLSRYVTSHSGQLNLAIPSWKGAIGTSQIAVTPCGCGVKARKMVRVWVAGKMMWSHCYIRAISERFRDKGLVYIKRYINASVYLYFYFTTATTTTTTTTTTQLLLQTMDLQSAVELSQISRPLDCADSRVLMLDKTVVNRFFMKLLRTGDINIVCLCCATTLCGE